MRSCIQWPKGADRATGWWETRRVRHGTRRIWVVGFDIALQPADAAGCRAPTPRSEADGSSPGRFVSAPDGITLGI